MKQGRGLCLFVTGATGFVGAALTLELLRVHHNDRAFCLVRGGSETEARNRLARSLMAAADAYDVPNTELESVLARVVALRGDLTAPQVGLSARDLDRLRAAGPVTVWHCAASLKDSEKALKEIVSHNVNGTELMLETLLPLGVRIFNHVSTAYVAGRKSGVVSESLERPRGFNNRYEQSKHYGEMLVVDHCKNAGVPFRIIRPAIVVSHSRTGRATGYTGFLGWVLKLAALNEMSGGALQKKSLRFVGRPEAPLNIIPIDSFVEDCLGIDAACETTYNRVFHLTNQDPPTVRWLANTITTTLGLLPASIVDEDAELDPVSANFHRWTRFERPYVTARKVFSRNESDRLYPSPRHGACPLDHDLIERMVVNAIADYQKSVARREGAA